MEVLSTGCENIASQKFMKVILKLPTNDVCKILVLKAFDTCKFKIYFLKNHLSWPPQLVLTTAYQHVTHVTIYRNINVKWIPFFTLLLLKGLLLKSNFKSFILHAMLLTLLFTIIYALTFGRCKASPPLSAKLRFMFKCS